MGLWKRGLSAGLAVLLLSGQTAAGALKTETPAELTLRVVCREGETVPADGTLTFVLWDEEQCILQQVVNLRGNASFAPLEFDTTGCYRFYITQAGGNRMDLIYDAAMYQVTVAVTRQDGQLTARVEALSRVCSDPVGEPRVLEALGRAVIPTFRNYARPTPPPMGRRGRSAVSEMRLLTEP